jgi:molecular chaperone Hsp33
MVLETGRPDGLEIQCSFVRGKNVLMAKANFSQLYVDYFLHLSDNHIKPSEEHVEMFKAALAAFSLHCASKPRNEVLSWTMNFQRPLVNLFLVGDTELNIVAGRIFDRDVKENLHNSFYQEVARPGKPIHRSYVDFTGKDPLLAVERFYSQSEQRPAKLFQLGDEEYAMISAHPDWDEEWFKNLDYQTVKGIEENEEVNILEKRFYSWDCGCSADKMYEVLVPMGKTGADSVFAEHENIVVNCPRCAGEYNLSRSHLDALIAVKAESDKE